jgi:hypothetical protein
MQRQPCYGGLQCNIIAMAHDEIDRLRAALAHAHEEHSPLPRRIIQSIMRRFGDRIEKQAIERIVPPAKPEKKNDAA